MQEYDNPAGRLDALLRALFEVAGGTPLLQAWAAVLGVDEGDTPRRLARATRLLDEVETAVERSGARAQLRTVARYRSEWVKPFFPSTSGFSQALQSHRSSAESLDALAGIAEYLHEVGSEGTVPDEPQLEELKDKLRALLDDIESAEDLAPDIRELLLARVTTILQSIDEIRVEGPRAVQQSMEALVGALLARGARATEITTVKHVVAVVAVVWGFFLTTPQVDQGLYTLESWSRGELVAGQGNADRDRDAPRRANGTDANPDNARK